MTCAVHAFATQAEPANRLARQLGVAHHTIAVHRFPDGESLVTVDHPTDTAFLYCSLDRPNDKLVELLLAASALRENGASKLILVAPYLAYMRQDAAFHPGEAVSQRVVARWLAESFDGLLTLDPHLHRTHSLAALMPGTEAVSLSAAPLLATAFERHDDVLLVGPDHEARQWVENVARQLGLEFVLGAKNRSADRDVQIRIPDAERARDRAVVLVDDLISSGSTLLEAAELLHAAGARRIDALATHCLASEADLQQLYSAGITAVRATDSVAGPVGILPTAALLAREIRNRGWCA
jgi:ribose-phosphate pyrophosphokinase